MHSYQSPASIALLPLLLLILMMQILFWQRRTVREGRLAFAVCQYLSLSPSPSQFTHLIFSSFLGRGSRHAAACVTLASSLCAAEIGGRASPAVCNGVIPSGRPFIFRQQSFDNPSITRSCIAVECRCVTYRSDSSIACPVSCNLSIESHVVCCARSPHPTRA